MGAGGGYGRGMDFLMKQRARVASKGGDWVPKLYLRNDGDVAKFRFLTDTAEVFSHNFHEVEVQGRSRKFTKDVVCARKVAVNEETGDLDFVDPAEVCKYCNRQEPLRMWWKGIAWVYTFGIFSLTKGDDKMVPARRGTGANELHGYLDTINEPRLLILKGLIADMVGSAAQRYGTLCDRNYELERKGKGGGQYYELVGLDRSKPSDAVLEFITYSDEPIEGDEEGRVTVTQASTDKLPDLFDTVMKEFSLDSSTTTPASPTPTQPQEGQPAGDEGPRAPGPRDDDVVNF